MVLEAGVVCAAGGQFRNDQVVGLPACRIKPECRDRDQRRVHFGPPVKQGVLGGRVEYAGGAAAGRIHGDGVTTETTGADNGPLVSTQQVVGQPALEASPQIELDARNRLAVATVAALEQ